MPVNIFQPVTNPLSGETFRGISFSEDAFIMQWIVQPRGYVPFEHIHLNQEEIFTVQSGELLLVLEGKECIVKKGESLRVPKGQRHIASNNQASILNCTIEYRPGLDHDKFMQCLLGLTIDGKLSKNGGIDIPRMGYFLKKMNAKSIARPTAIPAPLFNLALKVFYLRGSLSGWKNLYRKYTE